MRVAYLRHYAPPVVGPSWVGVDHKHATQLLGHGGDEHKAEQALVRMADGIADYANAMLATTERDFVMGELLGGLLSGWVRLLGGPRGRLDGGTCSAWALRVAEAIGWDMDLEVMK